jgi:hypothetical protein
MKKILLLIGIASLLFSSCLSTSTSIFDDSILEEKTTRIMTNNIGDVNEYNGIPVNWKQKFAKNTLYQIPAGDTLLEFDVEAEISYKSYISIKGASLKYNFQPQKEYWFSISRKNNLWGIDLYAWDYGDKNSGKQTYRSITVLDYDEANFVEFVPFNNLSNQKKVLN